MMSRVVNKSWRNFFPVACRLITRSGWQGAWSALSYHRSTSNNQVADKLERQLAGIDWLLAAWQAADQQGFSASYSFLSGWTAAYPETSGYIIPTLLNFIQKYAYRRDEIEQACLATGEWLLRIQHSDGSFPGYQTTSSMIFDTGQIIFGLLSLYRYSHDRRYLSALTRAADWVITNQSPEGYWIGSSHDPVQPHTYDARVAWALAEAGRSINRPNYLVAAQRQIDWVISQQLPNGWFKHSYLFDEPISVLHTIGYTLQGIIETSQLLNRSDYLSAVELTAQSLNQLVRSEGIKSYYTADWKPIDSSLCLTGLAQVAISLKRLGLITHNSEYIKTGQQIDQQLSSYQLIDSSPAHLRGGLGGSYPIWGRYLPWNLVNWSVKFYLDSLLLDDLTQFAYAG